MASGCTRSDYGWIWMPYGSQYTYEGAASDASPYSYVFISQLRMDVVGSTVDLGLGTYPYFGPRGPNGFGWLSRTVPGRVWMGRIPRRRLPADTAAAAAVVVG